MDFKPEDFVRVRVPVSNQWFHAFVLEANEDHYVVETMFPIVNQTTWRIAKHQIKEGPEYLTEPPKPSKSLQSQLEKFKSKYSNQKENK